MAAPLTYCGLTLDRAGDRRSDDAWLAERWLDARTRVVLLWRDRVLTADDAPLWTTPDRVPGDGAVVVFLGLADDAAVFAVDVSGTDDIAAVGATAAEDVRGLVGRIDREEAGRLAYARGLVHWNQGHRFCGACGQPTATAHGGHLRRCDGCGKLHFPRIEPAVITLVEFGDHCLLGRHTGSTGFSTLAGFVEVGESLEDAVRREVREEAGITVGAVEYVASQAWPFPAGLMVGFRAVAADATITVDADELAEARWFTRDEVLALRAEGARRDSIEDHLVGRWLGAAP